MKFFINFSQIFINFINFYQIRVKICFLEILISFSVISIFFSKKDNKKFSSIIILFRINNNYKKISFKTHENLLKRIFNFFSFNKYYNYIYIFFLEIFFKFSNLKTKDYKKTHFYI